MGHTNSTANLGLPQFIGTDKPTWLSDVNGAFSAIDTYAGTNDAALAITDAKADGAVNDAASALTTATNAANTAGTASTQATNAVTVAGNALTVANGINSKVGVLTDLTTTDKSTVVNAINEVNGKNARDIAYSNTGSGLTATNIQDAIDEIAQGGGGAPEHVEVIADGVKTENALLNELYALIDSAKVTRRAQLMLEPSNHAQATKIYALSSIDAAFYAFGWNDSGYSEGIRVRSSSSEHYRYIWAGTSDSVGSNAPTSGTKFTLYYS